ncbi:MAG: hypothetical protein HZA32_19340 [Opitutae bacterium]|nr:hypothetical protein [Opitutae bacterium]
MTTREKWGQALAILGGLAVLVGGIDPLDGGVVLFAGTALLAAAAFVSPADRTVQRARATNFALAAFGFGAIGVLSSGGGVGGATGRPLFWALLGLPLVAGWSLSFWGRGSLRWMNWLGLLAGGWYLALPLLVLRKSRTNPHILWPVLIALAVFGLLTVVGCVWRVRQRRPIAGNT